MAMTAAELMAKLEKDEDYQTKTREKEKKMAAMRKIYDEDEKELLKELETLGFSLGSVWDFVGSSNYYSAAVPTLIKHLTLPHHPRIMDGIVRSLAMQSLQNDDNLWQILLEMYVNTPRDEEINIPEQRGLQQAVALALETLATQARVQDLENIVKHHPNNDAIDWIVERIEFFNT